MKFFNRKEEKTRSIDEILTPKDIEEVSDADGDDELVEKEERLDSVGKHNEPITALNCFGWDESKTDKWLIKCANVWYLIISFLWFIFGAITFAPVIFVSNKVDVVFKDKKKSLICGVIIQATIIVLIFVFFLTRITEPNPNLTNS